MGLSKEQVHFTLQRAKLLAFYHLHFHILKKVTFNIKIQLRCHCTLRRFFFFLTYRLREHLCVQENRSIRDARVRATMSEE